MNHFAPVCQHDGPFLPFKKARDGNNTQKEKKGIFERLGPRQNEGQNQNKQL